jgi:SAM-dependent methyltransferase
MSAGRSLVKRNERHAAPVTARSYDEIHDFGVLYDSIPAYAARKDVRYYVAAAVKANGPVLELGCGTGRVLLPTARAVRHPVVGLDGSREMLARCRLRLADESPEVRERVTLHQGDARSFDLGSRFALITAPFRVMQHLTTIEDQLRVLECVKRQLSQDGMFTFDVFNPLFSALASDRSAERVEVEPQAMGDGRTMSRSVRVPRVRWTDQVSEIELVYYVTDPQTGQTSRLVNAFEMRWYQPAELHHLLARAGFIVESIDGDFEGAPLTDGAPELVVRCRISRKPQ